MTNSSRNSAVFGDFYIIGGTFLICCALLAFEVSTIRTVNFAIGPSYIFIAISLAMLGLTAAGSLLSLFDLSAIKYKREYVLASLCVAIAVLLVLANFFVADAKAELNEVVRRAGEAGGLSEIVKAASAWGVVHALRIGLFLTLPYFVFGAILSYLFSTSHTREYGQLYAADLLGAAVGCVAIIILMELTNYALSVTAPAICALIAGAAYVYAVRRAVAIALVGLAVLLGAFTQVSFYQNGIEPAADSNYLVRDYSYKSDQIERWSDWNNYTRVGASENANAAGQQAMLSLGNGDGNAVLLPYDPSRPEPILHGAVIPALLTDRPENALVVFAGAGADLMSLREHGVENVVGVEINENIVNAGLALTEYRLAEFLELENVSLHIDEARSFLERDQSKYDLIFLSWSGATAVYHLGALGGTTQYLFTYEGISSVLDHLSDNGHAVILQVNKLDVLHGLRRYMAERELDNPDRAAIVLFRDNEIRHWDRFWDDNPLLIKLNGWSDAEAIKIQSKAKEHGLHVAYAPGIATHPDYEVYERILTAKNAETEISQISNESGKGFGVATDNKPFYLDHFQTRRYLTADFWNSFFEPTDDVPDMFHFARVVFVIFVSLVAFSLAIAPLLFSRKRVKSRRRSAVVFSYFLLLGAGFMFVEIGLIQRTSILFGNPGLTIAIVLAAIILSTGLGSLMSNWSFSRGLTINAASMMVVVYAIGASLVLPPLTQAVMGASFALKTAMVVILISPGGLIMGHLFPQGLAIAGGEDKSLIPWAWAINGAMSASVAGMAPIVAQATGFMFLFYIGALLYAGILLLPMESSETELTTGSIA